MRFAATALLFAGLFIEAARASERGFPVVHLHDQRQHRAGSQLFDIAEGAGGLLHFGGLAGIATYDGAWWRTLPLPNNSAVFAIESGRGPEIAIGAAGEMGWIAPGAHGALAYHSLVPLLPPHARELGDVRAICTTSSGFLFAAESFVFSWSGGAPRIVADLRARLTNPPRCWRAGTATYVALDTGLERYDESSNALVSAGFEGKTIDAVLPFDGTRLLVAIRNEGLFLDSPDVPFSSAANELLRGRTVTAAVRLPGGRFLAGTRQDGVLIVDSNGGLEQRLGEAAGLPANVLTGALVDREGSLWLSYYGKAARLELDSPVSLFDARHGLRGGAMSVERHRGRTYITSSHGVFVLDPLATAAAESIRAVSGINGTAFDALSVDDDLLIATREGIYVLTRNDAPRRIDGTSAVASYAFERSKHDRALVWVATKRGAAMLRRTGDRWRYDGLVAGSPPYMHTVAELGDELWAGTVFTGAVRIHAAASSSPRVEQYGSAESSITTIAGRAVVVSEGRILQPLPGGRLAPHPLLGHIRGDFHVIAEDARGNVWLGDEPPRVVRRLRDGSYTPDPLPIVAIDAPQIARVEADGDVIWLMSPEILYRYDAAAAPHASAQPAPLIRRAVAADDEEVIAPLEHAFGRLHIEFAPASYRPGVEYQYRLDPVDSSWSAWTSQPSIDYTNLDQGDYTFRVRARGSAGAVSDETRWTFTVLPAWYRTRAALALWLLLFAIAIAAIVRLRTTALRRQADRLRAIVFERTEALQQANAHLERLSLLDELTGIANRRYFQRAVVEAWRVAHEQRQPLAIVLFDLDHFKQLNDRHGHAAGDAALIQVARHLSRALRRSGDAAARGNELIARIGGEEFALLLTQTSVDEAVQVADALRGGVERLPIALSSTVVQITVSAGVAARVPLETEGWNTLMREADDALYDAKAAGRNCVRAASAGGGEIRAAQA